MLVAAAGYQEVQERLAGHLSAVEARFSAELLSDLACVNSLVTHVERYRGKMLRPMLVFVSGMASAAPPTPESAKTNARPNALGELTEAHRVVATVVEMVHMATLVHDDVLDEADVRRRGATINHLRGNEAAVMLGDYLISHAYHLCSSLPTPFASRVIADATNTVCEGELLQLANRNNWSLDEASYIEVIRRKTASLCGTCCRVGAQLSTASPAVCEGLYTYGEKLGIAFQIIDDVLDMTASEATLGKSSGRDLEKGKATLPLIHHLQTLGDAKRAAVVARLTELARADEGMGEYSDEVRTAVISTDSVVYATAYAARLVNDAKEAIAVLPDSGAKSLLFVMADAVLTRKF
jgi:octaprenyl-diphosphate synthase